jgi:DNA-binding LacI/PurR family transcriptional regulator
MATITDVARSAGVSPGVVSRVLNHDSTLKIKDETRQRVLAAASELAYTPNHAARALRKARVGVIGLAVHDTSNPVYSEIVAGAREAAAAAGYTLLLADVDGLARDDEVFKQVVASGAIDGLLLQRGGTATDAVVARIASSSLPTVLLNDRSRGATSSVAVDDRAAATLATRHLLDLGHRRVGHLRMDGPRSLSLQRLTGWREALLAAGVEPDPALVALGGHETDTGYAGLVALLALPQPPTAVVAANVLAGIGALTAAREHGVRVPADLSLIALHDVFVARHLHPALTVVRLPLRVMGSRAVHLLLHQIEGGGPQHDVIVEPPPELVPRASTAPPSPGRRRAAGTR